MRVAVFTWGTRGDYQPFLALARGLKDAGHTVTLGAPGVPQFRDMADTWGIPFCKVGNPLSDEDLGRLLRTSIERGRSSAMRAYMSDVLYTKLAAMYQDALTAAQGADIVVSSVTQPVGRMVAETAGLPYVSATLMPLLIPTGSRPPIGELNLGRFGNRLLWKLVGNLQNKWWGHLLNRARTDALLAPLKDPFGVDQYSPLLNLIAASPSVVTPPLDWGPSHIETGYWFLDAQDTAPPPAVAAFLAAGSPPVLVTFGAMAPRPPYREGLWPVVVAAIRALGLRAILETSPEALSGAEGPDILCAPEVPHACMLPHVRAVVHHGGAGTSAGVFRAGVPAVVVPFIADQNAWSRRAAFLGVAPAPVPIASLTLPRLIAALATATAAGPMRARAEALSRRIRAEDGLKTAVELINEVGRAESASSPRRSISRAGMDRTDP